MKNNYIKIIALALAFSCVLSACSVLKYPSRKEILEFNRYKESGFIKAYDSIHEIYYSNGKLFFRVPYCDGEMNGWYEQYNLSGNLYFRDFYLHGYRIDGYKVTYDDNGHIFQEGFMKNGHEVGKWYVYFGNGSPFKCYIYNKKGKLIKTKEWNRNTQTWEKVNPY